MRWLRGTVNAVLVATLVRPVVRRLIARTRRRAREHPVSPLMMPVEDLLETALMAELAASRADREPVLDEAGGEHPERSTVSTLLRVGAAAAVVAIATVATVVIVRRRRSRVPQPGAAKADWVAVPVDAPADTPAETKGVDAPASVG